MLVKLFIVLFSTSVACLVVAMALESTQPLAIFTIADIVILTGMVIATPSIIYGYLKGFILWDQGVRHYKPYLNTALKSTLINGIILSLILGAPWMQDRFFVMALFLGAFACGGVVASALTFVLMHSWEKHNMKLIIRDPV